VNAYPVKADLEADISAKPLLLAGSVVRRVVAIDISGKCVVRRVAAIEFSPAFQAREELHHQIRVASATRERCEFHASLTRRHFDWSLTGALKRVSGNDDHDLFSTPSASEG